MKPESANISRPIGVFDSGMGGLTVLSALAKALPNESFIYLGDTARVPYGSRSPRTILRYSREVAGKLLAYDVKMIVIACNTVTAHAEDILTSELPVPVVGVIRPGAKAAAARSHAGRVGIAGTRSTIKSGAYEKELRKLKPDFNLFSKACPLFVPLVEEGWLEKKVTKQVIHEYFSELVREEVDAVILGCTHYPLLMKAISGEYPQLDLIDSSVETALAVKEELETLGLKHPQAESSGEIRILLTDVTDHIESLEKLFLGMAFQSVEEIQIEELPAS